MFRHLLDFIDPLGLECRLLTDLFHRLSRDLSQTGKGFANLKLDFKEWSQLIDRNYKDRRKEIFQTMIYSDILVRLGCSESILPAIYKLDDLFQEEFIPNVIYSGEKLIFQRVCNEFRSSFSDVLSEIFSTELMFDQTKDALKCSYRPYNKICQR